ncbi:YjdF family protein [Staphylococcus warneri]|uniref:YjdF family protein n=1 Tax=Staphylococcus warneri TaxID=1292 RepID=UPI00103ACCCB|nr:YjdF family protein [Staphylococcus warneri]TBW78883.1 DUF2992 family protein [Staphylococcus warneri]
MKLSIFHNGQFFIGLIEYNHNDKSYLSKYVFGQEPNDETVLNFINKKLLKLINKSKANIKKKESTKKINPKRLQRIVAKEQKSKGMSTQSQRALKLEQEVNKKEAKKKNKKNKELQKERQRDIKRRKAKEKHKGH